MVPDATSMAAAESTGEVMAAVEEAGSQTHYVIADISRDEAYVTAPIAGTCDLEAMR